MNTVGNNNNNNNNSGRRLRPTAAAAAAAVPSSIRRTRLHQQQQERLQQQQQQPQGSKQRKFIPLHELQPSQQALHQVHVSSMPEELLSIKNPLPVSAAPANNGNHPALTGEQAPVSQKHYQVFDDNIDVDTALDELDEDFFEKEVEKALDELEYKVRKSFLMQ